MEPEPVLVLNFSFAGAKMGPIKNVLYSHELWFQMLRAMTSVYMSFLWERLTTAEFL